MARSRISFDDASQSLLDAAIDPSRWNDAMETIAQYAGATGVVLLQTNGTRPGTPRSRSMEEGLEVYFRDGWHLRDERMRGVPFMRRKGIFVDQDFVTREEIATSDYYRGLLDRFGFNWCAGIGATNGDEEWSLVIQFDDEHGFVTLQEQKDLLRFGGQLKRAVLLANNLGFANATGMIDAYQSLGCASILLDSFGRVVRCNALAEALLGDGLELSRGVLRCSCPADNPALETFIAGLVDHSGLNKTVAPPPVALHRPVKRPLVVEGIRLKGMASAIFAPAKAILLISDSGRTARMTPADLMQRAFGLTAAEAMLVGHLEREVPLQIAADAMGIGVETARSHIKRVFQKTGTNRQSDLLMLIGRLRPIL